MLSDRMLKTTTLIQNNYYMSVMQTYLVKMFSTNLLEAEKKNTSHEQVTRKILND